MGLLAKFLIVESHTRDVHLICPVIGQSLLPGLPSGSAEVLFSLRSLDLH